MGGRSVERGKLTLEEYTDFFNNCDRLCLNVDQLNQIVFMHGFLRMHRRHKMEVLDALETLELMDPKRSTLQESIISSHAPLTAEEARADMEAIGWQGCRIVSLHSVGGAGSSCSAVASSSSAGDTVDPCSAAGGMAVRKRRRATRGRKRSTVRKVDQILGPQLPLLTYR